MRIGTGAARWLRRRCAALVQACLAVRHGRSRRGQVGGRLARRRARRVRSLQPIEYARVDARSGSGQGAPAVICTGATQEVEEAGLALGLDRMLVAAPVALATSCRVLPADLRSRRRVTAVLFLVRSQQVHRCRRSHILPGFCGQQARSAAAMPHPVSLGQRVVAAAAMVAFAILAAQQAPLLQPDGLAEQLPSSWGPLSGAPPSYLNDDERPLHHTPMDKGTWWGDNDAWYDGWEQHRVDLWPPRRPRHADETSGEKMLGGGGWKAMADDLSRGGNDFPEYKRTGMAPEYWERPGDEHDLDNAGKVSHEAAHLAGEEYISSDRHGAIAAGGSVAGDWKRLRPTDKVPPWCDRILGCFAPYDSKGEMGARRDGTTRHSWPYNSNGKKIQLGGAVPPSFGQSGGAEDDASGMSAQQQQAAVLEAQAERAEAATGGDSQGQRSRLSRADVSAEDARDEDAAIGQVAGAADRARRERRQALSLHHRPRAVWPGAPGRTRSAWQAPAMSRRKSLSQRSLAAQLERYVQAHS